MDDETGVLEDKMTRAALHSQDSQEHSPGLSDSKAPIPAPLPGGPGELRSQET